MKLGISNHVRNKSKVGYLLGVCGDHVSHDGGYVAFAANLNQRTTSFRGRKTTIIALGIDSLNTKITMLSPILIK